MQTEPPAACCVKVAKGSDGWRSRYEPCKRAGKAERNGKWYCGQHDPEAREARHQKTRERWSAEDIERRRQGRLTLAAPDMLALLIESQDNIGGDWRARRDAVVAKAIEATPQ